MQARPSPCISSPSAIQVAALTYATRNWPMFSVSAGKKPQVEHGLGTSNLVGVARCDEHPSAPPKTQEPSRLNGEELR